MSLPGRQRRLQWQPIKNLLRLHSVRMKPESGPGHPRRMHWLWSGTYTWPIVHDWRSHPDPQARIIEHILFIADYARKHAR